MLAIRLKRVGRKNDPSFRIIVQDHRRAPTKTRGLVEFVGSYDARKGTPQVNAERIKYWISMGAQPSPTVHNILVSTKVIEGKKVNAMNKKTKVVKAAPVEVAKPKPAAAPVAVETPAPAPVVEVAASEAVVEAPVVELPAAEVSAVPEKEAPAA
jgi:small subunit ribosomal protein S16